MLATRANYEWNDEAADYVSYRRQSNRGRGRGYRPFGP